MQTLLGQNADARIAPGAAEAMRRAIRETGGREVFFAGALDRRGLVESVRVCARGHDGAVPAVFDALKARDVVLHNHPSGEIEPSDADLQLAAFYSHNGHGVYIVDNEVTRVYVVIEPFLDQDRKPLDTGRATALLKPNGPFARTIPRFEIRPQQAAMMETVCRAFNEDGIAVIEAPTGVGKTLAYLVPAVQWALDNKERVVVSTRTINLQEQILFKDIPALEEGLERKFTAVLVKGRQNYVCPRRLERAVNEAALFDDEETRAAIQAIAEWAAQTKDGSKSDLSFVPKPEIWERVCSEADTCVAARCLMSNACFVARARREVAKADIVVVNHHMLFSDLAIKKDLGSFTSLVVLPAFRRLIIDEAHHVEDSATEYFGVQATRTGAMNLLGRLLRAERSPDRGLLPFLKIKLTDEIPTRFREQVDDIYDLIDNFVVPSLAATREALETAFQSLRSLTAEKSGQIGRDIKWRLTEAVLADPELREIHKVYVLPAADELTQLARHCAELLLRIQQLQEASNSEEPPLSLEAGQLSAYRERMLALAATLAEATGPKLEDNTVRWIEIDSHNKNIVRVVRCPLDVGKALAEWVYPNLKTIVMTSATLTVGRTFDFLNRRTGLDRLEGRPMEQRMLDSPFDFHGQAVVCIPDDLPWPDSPGYLDQVVEAVDEIIAITQGHAFVLFTSFYALTHVHGKLEAKLRAAGITALRQGETNRTHLLDRFRREQSAVLFATDSFWEGVDVAGEALQCVILPKLPFRVPTEPIHEARAEAIERAGGNAFTHYTVPLAVIKFRQGFGRLIRRRSDRGSVVVLDSRLLKKAYGKTFLESLPHVRLLTGPRREVFAGLRRFHERNGAAD